VKLILVRHGETLANRQNINQGQKDTGLTRKGREQAKKIGKRLADENIMVDIIYCSDLGRTKETAKEIMHYVQAPIRYVKALRERRMGIFEGTPLGAYTEHIKKHGRDLFHYKSKGGESIQEAFERVKKFYDECIDKHHGKTVLWITHGGAIAKLLLHLLSLEYTEYPKVHPDNCAMSIIEVDENKQHKVRVINCTKHL